MSKDAFTEHGVQVRGEIIAANPADVAAADQLQAAQPRLNPSTVKLCDWLPRCTVYVLNLDKLCELPPPLLDEQEPR